MATANTTSSVTITEGRPIVEGLELRNFPDPNSYRVVPGPMPGVMGIEARDAGLTLRGELGAPIRETGALTFWFATDRTYRSGFNTESATHKLIEVSDILTVRFIADPTSITLIVEWGGPEDIVFPRHIRIILPELPGPAWHHFALSWNGGTGEINAFLDGTAYYVPGEKVAPLPLQVGRDLAVHLGPLALAEIRLQATPLTSAELESQLPNLYRKKSDRLLGAMDLGLLDAADFRGETLYATPWASFSDILDWKIEGPAVITFNDGWMEMKSERANGPDGHIVNWCPVEFPDSIVVEWEFELLEEKGLCILFFAATGRDGLDLFDTRLTPRSGLFAQYINGDINCYHISYFANTPDEPRRVANLRKNRGFHLIANGPVGVATWHPGKIHHAILVKDGPHIRMAVDGHLIINYHDDGQRAGPFYTAGRIGFRQMQWTSARYRNFRVSALK